MTSCQNCLTPLRGAYCHECGQSVRGSDRFFMTLVNEAFDDIFSMRSRVWKTFGNLLFRPGVLTKEYFAGKRVRYIPPVRLYFTLSIVFFVVFNVATFFDPDTVEKSETEATTEQPAAADPTPASKQFGISIEDLEDDEASIAWLSEKQTEALREKIEKAAAITEANPDAATEYFLEVAPPLIFCLLPLFAVLLKLIYLRSNMFYTQHLVLAVHNHCFVFLWLTILTLTGWIAQPFDGSPPWLTFILFIWCPYYLWRSLRVVYEQGWLVTAIKYLLLFASYLALSLFGLITALILGVLTL